MQDNTIRILAEHLVKLRRRDRQGNRAIEHSTDYSEAEFDTNGVERDWGGNERCYQNTPGQTRDNV